MESLDPFAVATFGAATFDTVTPVARLPERLGQLLHIASEHETAGRYDAAEAALGEVLALSPELPAALHLSGIVAFRTGKASEAIERIERAIARNPNEALFHRNICEIYRRVGRYDDAVRAGQRAVELDAKDAAALVNLSVVHYHRLELDRAIAYAEQALAVDPELAAAHFGIAEASLLRGDLERGWAEYEWRYGVRGAPRLLPPTDRPQWDGSELPPGATLLLIADQGFGDVIQFLRYVPWAARRCARIVVACSGEVQALIRQQPGVEAIFDYWQNTPEFAAYCPLSGLPRLAGTRLDTIFAEIPYLRSDGRATANWAGRLDDLLPKGWRRIGVVWAGRATHPNDDVRSLPIEALAPLTNLPGIGFISLQKMPGQTQVGRHWGAAPLINLGAEISDFCDTMAIIDNLELVITVDTAVAHLAGAMGKPVWLMLPYAPDWRWLLHRTDSPWYPTARLFRQSASRQWQPVVAAIADELSRGNAR